MLVSTSTDRTFNVATALPVACQRPARRTSAAAACHFEPTRRLAKQAAQSRRWLSLQMSWSFPNLPLNSLQGDTTSEPEQFSLTIIESASRGSRQRVRKLIAFDDETFTS